MFVPLSLTHLKVFRPHSASCPRPPLVNNSPLEGLWRVMLHVNIQAPETRLCHVVLFERLECLLGESRTARYLAHTNEKEMRRGIITMRNVIGQSKKKSRRFLSWGGTHSNTHMRNSSSVQPRQDAGLLRGGRARQQSVCRREGTHSARLRTTANRMGVDGREARVLQARQGHTPFVRISIHVVRG